jgi:hypothetical protein
LFKFLLRFKEGPILIKASSGWGLFCLGFKSVELLLEFGELKAKRLELLPQFAPLMHEGSNVLIGPLSKFKGTSPSCFLPARGPGLDLFGQGEQLAAQFPRLELLLPATVVKIPLAVLEMLFAQQLVLTRITAQKLL